jgi:hypothetical protein
MEQLIVEDRLGFAADRNSRVAPYLQKHDPRDFRNWSYETRFPRTGV